VVNIESVVTELDEVESNIHSFLLAHNSQLVGPLQQEGQYVDRLQRLAESGRAEQESADIAAGRRQGRWRRLISALSYTVRVLFWSVPLFVFRLGMSKVDLRWYRVRRKVLKLISQRENLRSQLLFHQATVAAS
jgi:hypothetical protein